MVVDKLENLEKYASLNPLFADAIAFLKATNLDTHELGKLTLKENELTVNFAQARPKSKEEAKLETHNNFIDIQLPLSGVELMGYTPRADLKPGMFAIFFPEDGHAPGITPDGVKKVIVKVRIY